MLATTIVVALTAESLTMSNEQRAAIQQTINYLTALLKAPEPAPAQQSNTYNYSAPAMRAVEEYAATQLRRDFNSQLLFSAVNQHFREWHAANYSGQRIPTPQMLSNGIKRVHNLQAEQITHGKRGYLNLELVNP